MRDLSVSRPSPDRSARAAERPVMARTSDSCGPVTSGPLPVDQSVSVERRVRPAIRRLAPTIMLEPWKNCATRTSASGGYSRVIPSGRRMSSEWITASPSIDSTGPGGWVVSLRWSRKFARPAVGDGVASAATPLAFMLLKTNPAPANEAKNLGGVILAVADMLDCPTMRIILAVRLSRDRPETTSVDTQLAGLRDYATRGNHTVVAECIDVDESG